MTAKQAVTILRKHNKWRRGDDRVKQAEEVRLLMRGMYGRKGIKVTR